jgi:hypothetical protein
MLKLPLAASFFDCPFSDDWLKAVAAVNTKNRKSVILIWFYLNRLVYVYFKNYKLY